MNRSRSERVEGADNPTGVAVLAERLGGVSDRLMALERVMEEIKGLLGEFGEKLQGLEKTEVGCQAVTQQKVTALEKDMDALKQRIDQAEKIIARLNVIAGLLTFVGGSLALSVVALIWSLITGQAQVTFR